MKINYTENEKRHIFESETGHVSTFLKERITKEQAEVLFQAQLANEGFTVTADIPVTEPEVLGMPLLEEDVVPEKPAKKTTKNA